MKMLKTGALNRGAANFVYSESVNATPEISEKSAKKAKGLENKLKTGMALFMRPASG